MSLTMFILLVLQLFFLSSMVHSAPIPSFLPTRNLIVADEIIERIPFKPSFDVSMTDNTARGDGFSGPDGTIASGSSAFNPAGSDAIYPSHPIAHAASTQPVGHYPPQNHSPMPEADKIDLINRPIPPPELVRKMGWDRK